MIRAGFENVIETRYKWPMNHWPKNPYLKELERWNQRRLYEGLESYMLRLLIIADDVSLYAHDLRSRPEADKGKTVII